MACLGFSFFGWLYFLMAFWLWPAPNGVSAPPFLTKALLDAVEPSLKTSEVMTVDPGPVGEMRTEPPPYVSTKIGGNMRPARYTGRVINLLHYRRIGHMLAAIAFGLVGGLLGTIISALGEAGEARRQNREREGT
jgi:hypothetical protein